MDSDLAGFTVSTEEDDLLVTSSLTSSLTSSSSSLRTSTSLSVGVTSPPEAFELTEGLEASLTPESASSEEEIPPPLRSEPPAPEDEGVDGPKYT